MALLLTSGPVNEPVSLAEAKAHMRVDTTDEDTLISSLITSARILVETSTSKALITQSWSHFLDDWPSGGIVRLPLSPLLSVGSIKTFDANDISLTISSADYYVDTISDPARIVMRAGKSWPSPGRALNGIEISFTAGYGLAGSDLPATLRQATLLLIAHWFERREPVVLDERAHKVPYTVATLLGSYRSVCL